MSIPQTRTLLMEKGVKPTQQRMAVYEYLVRHPVHPTAETIYHDLAGIYPGFSRATVYNSLNRLAQAGLIKVLTIDPEEQRFDGTIADHGHYRCLECGQVFDFDVNFDTALQNFPKDVHIQTRELFCTGICPSCRKQ